MRDGYKILSLEAKDLFGAMNQKGAADPQYRIRNAEGKINLKKFTNALDWSLDSMKLEEVYRRRARNRNFSFSAGRHKYTTNVICVTFRYSYKEFNMAGRNTFIRAGYSFSDCKFTDGACVIGDTLVGIQTNIEVQKPLPKEILGEYFVYKDGCYEQAKNFMTIMDKADLRNYLYENGFKCDGVEYVRYKRSAGSSRVGKCLFVNKMLAADMEKWDKCGLNIQPGQEIDLAAWEAYISLTMSSIIDTVEIPRNSILVIDDYDSVFEDEVVSVEVGGDGMLTSKQKRMKIKNCIWDGESIGDVSLFGRYRNKGMLLLRNQFFKSCVFNCNLQSWFADNNITSVDQLNGFTLADDISQIKLITTPSSIKYAKFGSIETWLRTVGETFGIVKYEKPSKGFHGKLVQAHYQLFNTLHLSYDDVKDLLKDSFDYLSAIKRDPAVLRYEIEYPFDDRNFDENGALKSRNEIVFRLLGVNEEFTKTKLYYDFRDDLLKGKFRGLMQGHILVNGNYSTICGNGLEMLKAAIGTFRGESELGVGNIHSKKFGFGQTILGTRSPHILQGNILLAKNVENENIDKYFNLSSEIVCVNAIGENIQQRLNGCDYDSDTMLLTDNELLIRTAERYYDLFKVPTNFVEAKKIKRRYTNEDKADLDVKTSVNKIGEIVNLSQQLNSLFWDRVNNGEPIEDCMGLYRDTCRLAVLSGIEIDRAKKEYSVNSGDEINALKEKYKITDDGMVVKPMFFKMITTENGYELSDRIRYRYFETAMDYIQKAIKKFKSKEAREYKKSLLPFISIVKKPQNFLRNSHYYHQKDKIVNEVRESRQEIKRLYTDYYLKTKEERKAIQMLVADVRQDCIDAIDAEIKSPSVIYLLLKELDSPETKDVYRYLFDVLFGRPDESFFKMIDQSKGGIEMMQENPDGETVFYGYKFARNRLR